MVLLLVLVFCCCCWLRAVEPLREDLRSGVFSPPPHKDSEQATFLSIVPRPFAYGGGDEAQAVEGERLVDMRWIKMEASDVEMWASVSAVMERCRVEVREARLGTRGAAELVRGLERAARGDASLRCVLCFLGQGAATLLACPKLKRLAIEFDSLDARALEAAARKLRKRRQVNNTLEELSLRYNQIDSTAAASLEGLLRCLPHLKRLYFCGNAKFGDECLARLARALPEHLEVLSLSNCGLSDEGCFALADALLQRRHIDIDLSRNKKITGAGVCALLEASNFRRLDLRGCSMGDHPLLPKFLQKQASSLEYAALGDNNMGPYTTAKVATVLLTFPCLKFLDLSFNLLTPFEAQKFAARPKSKFAKITTKISTRIGAEFFGIDPKRPKIDKNKRDDAIFGGGQHNKKDSVLSLLSDDGFTRKNNNKKDHHSSEKEKRQKQKQQQAAKATTTDALVAIADALVDNAPSLELLRLVETGVTAPHNRRFKRALKLRKKKMGSSALQLDLRMNPDIDREPEQLHNDGPVAMVVDDDDDDD